MITSAKTARPHDRPRQSGRPRRRAPQERPQEILQAAFELFVEHGYAATSMNAVAARAGLSKAAIYLYFADKKDLFEAVVRSRVLPLIEGYTAAFEQHQGPVIDLIDLMVGGQARILMDENVSGLVKLVIAESRAFPEIGRFWLDEVVGRGLPLIARIVARGVATGEFRPVDPELTARSIMAPFLMGAIWRSVFEPIGAPAFDAGRFAPAHGDFIRHALVAPRGHGDGQ